MIDSETATLDVLKASVPRDAFADRVAVVARALRPGRRCWFSGECGCSPRTAAGARCHRHGALASRVRRRRDRRRRDCRRPRPLLLHIARALPGDDVTLEHLPDESVLLITSGPASYRMHTYPAEDFPQLPDVGAAAIQRVDAAVLLSTIGRVSKSASRDESRPVLTGIFELRGREARDGRDRLLPARRQADRSPVAAPDLEAIIPARALQELSRIAGPVEQVELALQENHVVFGAEGIGSRPAGSTGSSRTTASFSPSSSSTNSKLRAKSSSTSSAASASSRSETRLCGCGSPRAS